MLNIYKASAGSGKTFTLAREFIRLLLGYTDPSTGKARINRSPREVHRHILAITFTNKATEEMKRRIIHELAVLARLEPGWGDESPYEKDFISYFGCSPEELRRVSAIVLRQLLFDFNFFSVSTIDSFFQVILRTFAREAELTGNYDVELDDNYAVSYGVRELLTSLNLGDQNPDDPGDERLKNWLTLYMESKIDAGAGFNLFNRKGQLYNEMISFVSKISNETFTRNYDRLMEYLGDSTRIERFATEIKRQTATIAAGVASKCQAAVGAITSMGLSGNKSVNSTVESQLRLWASGKTDKEVKKTILNVVDNIDKAYYSTFNKKIRQANTAAYATLDALIAGACAAIADSTARLIMLRNSTAELYLLGLIARVFGYIDRFRNENELILLSDTNSLLRKIIGEDDAPFVYERVGQWFNHFLIDEFQDTSPMQWENLYPLLKESLSTDNYNLIIGDEKQCIYRFRDSDPALLKNIHDAFPGRSRICNSTLEGNTNWRSSAEVVRANNTLFAAMSANLGFSDIYANITQAVAPRNADRHGYVKLTGLEAATVAEYSEAALSTVASDIERQLASGYRPGDIAVLVRTNIEGARVISYLMELAADPASPFAGMRIVSDDSMFLNSSPAVRLIVSVMKFVAGTDTVADSRNKPQREIARLLNRYEYGVSRGTAPGDALLSALHDDLPVEDIADDAAAMRCTSLPSLVERIISRYVPAPSLEGENMFITAFQDVVSDFVARGATDLRSFLRWWDEKADRLTVGGTGGDALRVLTIHKSKGLEFRCVHIPFVCSKVPKFRGVEWFVPAEFEGIDPDIVPPLLPILPSSWMENTPYAGQYARMVDEQRLDELNAVYVAFTRAVDELSVCYDTKGSATTGRFVADAIAAADENFCAMRESELHPEAPLAVNPFVPLKRAGNITEVGEPTHRREEKKARLTALDPRQLEAMPPYRTSDRDDLWANTVIEPVHDIERPRERGIVLHRLMSGLRHASDLDTAVRRMVARGYIPSTEAEAIKEFVASRIASPKSRRWFEGFTRVINERPIIAGTDDRLYRPDRVVWTADGTVEVIDYKFGSEHSDRYLRQVRGYMDRLAEAGYTPVRGYIWYVETDEVIPVR